MRENTPEFANWIDELLYYLGKQPIPDFQPYDQGLLLVGKRRAEDTYAIVVWHTLFPWALKYLGLEAPSP